MSVDNNGIESLQKQHCSLTRFVEKKGSLVWKIKGFTTRCPCKMGERLTSPKFRIQDDERDWWMHVYPKGHADAEDFISLYVETEEGNEDLITCEFSLIDVSGESVQTHRFSQVIPTGAGYSDFMSKEELLEKKLQLLPDDELTISCILAITHEITNMKTSRQQEGIKLDGNIASTLTNDLAKLFQEKKNTDVVLKVGTEQIPAHKVFLMSRSPVFASMFEHDLLENDTSEVVITDVEFDVLNELVRFMYTDLVSLCNGTFVRKLLVAADKYDVQSLKTRCAKFLYDSVSVSDVIETLRIADTCSEEDLSRKCMEVIESEMFSVASLSNWICKVNDRPEVLSIIGKLLEAKHQPNDG